MASSSSVPSQAQNAPVASIEVTPQDDDFIIASRVAKLLSGLSNKRAKNILGIVSSQFGSRIIPVGIPIGTRQTPVSLGGGNIKGAKAPSPMAKKPWNTNKGVLALLDERTIALAALKAAPKGEESPFHLRLKDVEARLKAAKAALGKQTSSRSSPSTGENTQEEKKSSSS